MKHYRALISIPIAASSDNEAITVANERAASVLSLFVPCDSAPLAREALRIALITLKEKR